MLATSLSAAKKSFRAKRTRLRKPSKRVSKRTAKRLDNRQPRKARWLANAGSMSDDVFRWVIAIGVFVAVVAFLVQTVVIFAVYRVTKATQDKLMPIVEAVTPILGTVRRFVDENTPKLSHLTTDMAAVVRSLHEQVNRLGDVVKEVSDRARAQVARIDGAVDQTVEQVQQASEVVK